MPEKRVEEKIIKSLKKKENQNILDLSSSLKLDRHTMSKYLEILKTKGLVSFVTKGKAKLWKVSENSFTKLLEINDFVSNQVLGILSDLDYDVSIQSKNYDVIWHNDKEKKIEGKCYELFKGKKVPCKNCPSEKVFRLGSAQKKVFETEKETLTNIYRPIKNEKGVVIAVLELKKKEKKIMKNN